MRYNVINKQEDVYYNSSNLRKFPREQCAISSIMGCRARRPVVRGKSFVAKVFARARARTRTPFPRGIANRGKTRRKNHKVYDGPYTRGSAYNRALSDRESCRAMTSIGIHTFYYGDYCRLWAIAR